MRRRSTGEGRGYWIFDWSSFGCSMLGFMELLLSLSLLLLLLMLLSMVLWIVVSKFSVSALIQPVEDGAAGSNVVDDSNVNFRIDNGIVVGQEYKFSPRLLTFP